MTAKECDKLTQLTEITDLKKYWEHEALDFTPWLAKKKNIELLSKATNLNIEVIETESSVGNFSADILAKDLDNNRTIIIENQLEPTDHTHLGQIITYLAGKEASIVIWVTKKARDEHIAAVNWLNAHTDDSTAFFLCETKLYKIGDSAAAVNFDVICKPNEWEKESRNSLSTKEKYYYDYWSAFIDYAYNIKEFSSEFRKITPYKQPDSQFYSGVTGCSIIPHLLQNGKLRVNFRIWNDKNLYHILFANKEAIEKDVGVNYEWAELPENKASRIFIEKTFKNAKSEEAFAWLAENILKMKRTFYNYCEV